jgi:hypothetical protein
MLRSVWSVWFDTKQGAFAMVLRIFDCDLCMGLEVWTELIWFRIISIGGLL